MIGSQGTTHSAVLTYKNKHIVFLSTILSTLVVFLVCIGLVFIYSSSSVYALKQHGVPHYFVKKQIYGVILGFFVLLIARLTPLSLIKKYTSTFFLFSLLFTAATLIPGIGVSINGSRRWLSFGGFSFQPSEVLKMSCILYCAYQVAKKKYSLKSFYYGYLPFLCIFRLYSRGTAQTT